MIDNKYLLILWNLEKIYCPEEERERALKALRLNGDISPDYNPRLLAASSVAKKPTIRIKRLSFSDPDSGIKLKEAPSIQGQVLLKEKREVCEYLLKSVDSLSAHIL